MFLLPFFLGFSCLGNFPNSFSFPFFYSSFSFLPFLLSAQPSRTTTLLFLFLFFFPSRDHLHFSRYAQRPTPSHSSRSLLHPGVLVSWGVLSGARFPPFKILRSNQVRDQVGDKLGQETESSTSWDLSPL
jgi:hypothetical protein